MMRAHLVDLTEVTRFFRALFGGLEGVIELRALPGADRIFLDQGIDGPARHFLHQHRGQNLFAGVALRQGPPGVRHGTGGGTLAQCVSLPAFFIDLDFKAIPIDQARAALRQFPLKPSIVVRSGGGVHAYWLLREPMLLCEEAARAKDLLRRLARHLGGDLSAAEPARILRLPGSWNFKYTPPRPVEMARIDGAVRFNPIEFDLCLPAEALEEAAGAPSVVPDTIDDGERN